MKHSLAQWSTAFLVTVAIAGCGGGNGNGSPPVTPVVPVVAANPAIAAASLLAANDSATNPATSFTVLQNAGITPVTINSPPKVNFVVFSDGKVKSGLTATNVSFAIAKLVPGSNGNPDQWVNYVYRTRLPATAVTGTVYSDAVKATLTSPAFPLPLGVLQAYTDPKTAGQLVYNADGYYTYTFSTDIKDALQTNGVVFEPNRTHRIAIQLSYTNAAGEAIKVNPYFDFTIDANGKSVAVTDPTKTRKMTDMTSCNGCHDKLGLHGGGRVDTQYCVMCHNPGTTDANSGNVLTLSTMVHKIHAGRLLASGGQNFTVRTADFSEVGFPQDLRNCAVCHSGANANTPQGDNWKTQPSKEACLTCHTSAVGSTWEILHKAVAGQTIGAGTAAMALPNSECVRCHGPGTAVASERVHFNQVEINAAKYKVNIESATFNDTADHKARSVTVKYFLADPTNGNAAYNLVTSDCTYTGTAGACVPPGTRPTITTKFGNLRFYLAYQNMVGQAATVTEYSAYNNGGSAAAAYLHTGTKDASNHYTVNIPLPDDSAVAVAKGTARVISIGQVKELKLSAISALDPRTVESSTINTGVQHTYKEIALTGTLQPRRTIVSNDKCNVCHGLLGTTSGSNTLANAFHEGGRNTVEACVLCHDANRVSSTVMTNGLSLNESYQFKRMIHGIHGNSKRTYPFTNGNKVVGAFGKDGLLLSDGVTPMTAGTENFAAEVAWPGVGINCNACHVNNSYKSDQSPLGAVVKKDTGVTDPALWKVISPKAATCTACHDSSTAQAHVINYGGATYGTRTQADVGTLLPVVTAVPRESCDDCHASGGAKSVDLVHGQK